MERKFDAYKLSLSMFPSIFNSFPVIRTASAKKIASRTAAHILLAKHLAAIVSELYDA